MYFVIMARVQTYHRIVCFIDDFFIMETFSGFLIDTLQVVCLDIGFEGKDNVP